MEADFIAWLRSRLPAPPPSLLVGPGDDGRVVARAEQHPLERRALASYLAVDLDLGALRPDVEHDRPDELAQFLDLGADVVGRRLWKKIRGGETLTDKEQMQADAISQDEVLSGLTAGNKKAAARGMTQRWLYMNAGRDVARSMAARRGVKPTFRSELADALSTPGTEARREIEKLEDERRGPNVTPEQHAEIVGRIEDILAKEAERLEKAAKRLMELGIDPRLVTEDYFKDLVTFGRIMRTVNRYRSTKWDWFVEFRLAMMLSGPKTQVANATGNAANIFMRQFAGRIAEAMANVVVRSDQAASFGEVAEYLRSWLPAGMKAVNVLMRAFATDMPAFEHELKAKGVPIELAGLKLDTNRRSALPDNIIGRAIPAPSQYSTPAASTPRVW